MSSHAFSTPTSSLPLDRRFLVPLLAACFLLAAMLLCIGIGPVYLTPAEVWRALVSGETASTADVIVRQIRLPRVLVGAMVGANLAMSGAILQGITRNRLTDPHIVGISSGAGLVAVSCIVLFPVPLGLVSPLAFLGGISAGALAYLMAWRGGVSPERLALAGIAVSAMLTAVTSAILVTSAFSAQIGLRWLIGGLLGRNWQDFQLLLPYFALGSIAAMAMARQLNVIALGDEIATSLGQHVQRTRFLLAVTAAVLAASAVSIAGLIGFIGLIVPHFVRLVIGNDYRFLLPTSALFGALLVVVADTAARTLFDPHELPVGVFTAVMGGPVFILLVRHRT
jgi:iron complex transport system permease protein